MLRLEGLNAGYGTVQILWNVSLTVGRGEIVGLVGRNGVGKSTTLRTVVGLTDVWSGEVWVGEHRFVGAGPTGAPKIGVGYVAQEREICPALTVEENLKVPLFAARRPLEKIKDVYERFPRLRERAHQRAGSLSGGERKLLAFSRIMLLEPAVYLIDEPTEGLMPAAVAEIITLIREMRDQDATVLLVEQNLDVVRELSDRIYLMNVGRVMKCVDVLSDADAEQFLGV